MYSNFVFLDRFLFELSCKNTHTHKHTHTHRDSNEYPIVAFSKNATIINMEKCRTSTITVNVDIVNRTKIIKCLGSFLDEELKLRHNFIKRCHTAMQGFKNN